ncbi:hypothetical protein GCM10010924_13510 [Rhizobium wenxiniae]|uniref:Uncharacterized protein n=1 Tax=Rhizobium wenxiniae TaxID=1737357 RepID=A0A7X0CYE5_9HYPH|nr:hypothetical protein [Rhizobium wenxiniae]MBB6161199.1 hypothetical protein [Rhizobium wenxiniae]GGF87099.1 hypothetical protein GCM10010924_13510 [Rhizobium wenxiniae]
MALAVKKPSTGRAAEEFDQRFKAIRTSAEKFNKYESGGHDLLYEALGELFTFGRDISKLEEVFGAFLKASDQKLKLNKVTKENPYNALVKLAFGNQKSKSWLSELSTVLAYATDQIGNVAFTDWIKEGGVKARYEEAVEYSRKKKGKKTNSLRSTQLESIRGSLRQSPISAAISGLPEINEGYHRSLLYSDGKGNTFLVDIKNESETISTDKYLLELAKQRIPDTHPLKSRPLFNLYRAIDLIVGTCAASSNGKGFIRFRNDTSEGSSTTTKLDFVSDAPSFAHASVVLAAPIAELGENGVFVMTVNDAKQFAAHFPSDPIWSLSVVDGEVHFVDDSSIERTVKLLQLEPDLTKTLRQGQALTTQSRQFKAIAADMKHAIENLPKLLIGKNAPKALSWDIKGNQMWLISPAHMLSGLDFLSPVMTVTPIGEDREMSMADLSAFIGTVVPYNEDLTGYIADSDVKDAAFCIDHIWSDGDRFLYVSPFAISANLDRTMVCEELR